MYPLALTLVVVSCAAAYFDWRWRKIPNWLILFGIVSGISVNAYQGSSHLLLSVLGLVLGIVILLFPFARGWIGAGDVKFFGVIGALLGAGWLPRVFFYSAVAAGLISFVYIVIGNLRLRKFGEYWLALKLAVLSWGRILPGTATNIMRTEQNSVPWGVAFAAGTVFAYFWDPHGNWAGF